MGKSRLDKNNVVDIIEVLFIIVRNRKVLVDGTPFFFLSLFVFN